MGAAIQTDLIAERVERLLVRYDEMKRTQLLMAAQIDALTLERDSLRSRLAAARSRVDALLDRLPDTDAPPDIAVGGPAAAHSASA